MKIKWLWDTIFRERTAEATPAERNAAIYGSAFLAAVSAVLTVMNFNKHYWFMMGTTSVLILGFLAAIILAVREHLLASRIITAVMCGIVFSVYAATGENDGFAILWTLLVPILSMNLVGLRVGFLLSAYFQFFLIVLFYTPLSDFVRVYYTATFISRFPVLYFASFGACTIMMCQKQDLYRRVHRQAYTDGLTGLYNRAYYIDYSRQAEELPGLTIIAMDLNGLKAANDSLGHEAGDRMICDTAAMIRTVFPEDTCFRLGGDEFAVIAGNEEAASRIEAFRAACPNVSLGYACRRELPELSFFDLAREADRRMYSDKENYYQTHGKYRASGR